MRFAAARLEYVSLFLFMCCTGWNTCCFCSCFEFCRVGCCTADGCCTAEGRCCCWAMAAAPALAVAVAGCPSGLHEDGTCHPMACNSASVISCFAWGVAGSLPSVSGAAVFSAGWLGASFACCCGSEAFSSAWAVPGSGAQAC